MFKGVYYNRVTQGIELMICDVFTEANSYYKFDTMIEDPTEYIKLTDNILEEIEYSTNPALNKSRDLIKKLKKRDIYRFACEIMLDHDFSIEKEEIVKAEIASYASKEGVDEVVSPNDIYLITGNINFGLQTRNPVEHTKFFHKGDTRSTNNFLKFCPINEFIKF